MGKMPRINACPETNPIMMGAWAACLEWAIFDKDIMADYTATTGKSINLPKTQIDLMVDQATGALESQLDNFVGWFNLNIWGIPE